MNTYKIQQQQNNQDLIVEMKGYPFSKHFACNGTEVAAAAGKNLN